jgi:putative oxidoreductase
MLARIESLCPLAGRIILGLYFLLPGAVLKLADLQGTSEYMASKGMVLVPLFLWLTIALQAGGGLALLTGWQTKIAAFLLAGLTLVISIVMHDFWDVTEAVQRGHETQNFVKNMGIMAGLLAIAGLGAGPFSLDNRRRQD